MHSSLSSVALLRYSEWAVTPLPPQKVKNSYFKSIMCCHINCQMVYIFYYNSRQIPKNLLAQVFCFYMVGRRDSVNYFASSEQIGKKDYYLFF